MIIYQLKMLEISKKFVEATVASYEAIQRVKKITEGRIVDSKAKFVLDKGEQIVSRDVTFHDAIRYWTTGPDLEAKSGKLVESETDRLRNLLTNCYNCDSLREVKKLIEEEIKKGE